MPQLKLTMPAGASRDDLTVAAGTVIAGGNAIEVNVDTGAGLSQMDVLLALKRIGLEIVARQWPLPGAGEGGGGGPSVPVAAMPITVRGRWSANHSTVTVAGGRVESATATEGASAGPLVRDSVGPEPGPLELTDGLGRKFWRFDNTAVLQERLLSLSTRNCTIIMVGRRISRGPSSPSYMSLGYVGGAPQATNGAWLRTTNGSRVAHFLRGAGQSPQSSERWKVVHGMQLHVFGVSGSAGAPIWRTNQLSAAGTTALWNATGTGFEVGRYSAVPESSGSRAAFDLYELIVTDAMTAGEMDTAWTNLQAAYDISNIVHQIVMEGDSITYGWQSIHTPPVLIGESVGERLGEPGGVAALPNSWRVMTTAVNGDEVPDLVLRRDAADSMATMLLQGLGQNVVSIQIGVNDSGPGSTIVSNIVALLNTTTTGYLQRGWNVLMHTNIAVAQVDEQAIGVDIRAGLQAAQFLTDTLSGTGQAFEGKVQINPLHLWQVSGNEIFNTSADAGDNAYYQTDGLHPNPTGTLEYAKSVKAALGL